jgi:CubicO group peptidase (beta-lactamase class C family)
VSRRDVLQLMIAGGAVALGSCVAAPRQPEQATLVPATATPPEPARLTQTSVPTLQPTAAPTAAATTAPTAAATTSPTHAPTSAPTIAPTVVPTLATPPALAAAIQTSMERAVQSDTTPGGVALVRHDGKQLLLRAYGLSHKYDGLTELTHEPIPAAIDTLYDLASITKLFTTTAAMRLVEQGRLTLDEPVSHWLPDFAAGGKEDVTLRQLLTHTSGLPPLIELWKLEATPDARVRRVLATPVVHPPGTVFVYSDLGLIAMGSLLEQVVGASLDRIVHDLVLDPLRLDQLVYRPPRSLQQRVAPTEYETDPDRGMVWGEVHDPNAWSLGGVAGHAGLFGTAEQLGRFAQLYLDGGVLDGTRLLQASTVEDMTRNQIGDINWRGLGWELNASYYMGHLASMQTYGHTGFTGTSLVIDPRRKLIVVLLTNRVHPTRDGPSLNRTRQDVANAAMAAVDAA